MATSKRARTADREAAVELINTAYVDGQLTATERDAKVSRALVARTLAQLEGVTSGLQRPQPAAPPTDASAGGLRGWWRGRSRPTRIGIAVAVMVALSAGAVVWLNQPEDEPHLGRTAREPVSGDIETVLTLLADYESEFGTTQSYGIIVMRDWTRVLVPTDDGRARYEEWTLVATGQFEKTGARGAEELEKFDLTGVDLDALGITLDDARAGLGVENPNRTDITIDHRTSDKRPRITVGVANKYEESAYVITNLEGNVLTSKPLRPPGS